jgi:hypothetical protein
VFNIRAEAGINTGKNLMLIISQQLLGAVTTVGKVLTIGGYKAGIEPEPFVERWEE